MLLAHCAKLGKLDIVGWLVLRVMLELGPLEVLHAIALAVKWGYFAELIANRVAAALQRTIVLPVGEELADYAVAGFGEVALVGGGGSTAARVAVAGDKQAQGQQLTDCGLSHYRISFI